jgi:hypothetical protein
MEAALVLDVIQAADGLAEPARVKMPPRCLVWVATASRGADLVFLGSAESRFSAPA